MKSLRSLMSTALLVLLAATPLSALAQGGAGTHAGHAEHGGHAGHGKHGAAAPEQKPWGIAGDPRRVSRTIQITMGDNMRFAPARLQVREGETVRFVVRNSGQLQHEMVLGTRASFKAHAAMMAKAPGMAHDEPEAAHVAPGKQASLVWTFNRAGSFEFACLVPGHFEAGMVGQIEVMPAAGAGAAPAVKAKP